MENTSPSIQVCMQSTGLEVIVNDPTLVQEASMTGHLGDREFVVSATLNINISLTSAYLREALRDF